MISRELRTWLARIVRKLIIRGRSSVGYFSAEGYESAPDEPTQNMTIRRGQHYGFISEPPEGTECIAVAINAGASNRVSVAEWTTDEPAIDVPGMEVLVWCRNGQRILLNKDGDVVIYPAAGRHVLLGGADASDPVVTKSTFDALVSAFNGHIHGLTHATADTMTGVITGSTDASTSASGVAPSRVTVAK